jgi:hypothetical protein
MKRYRNRASLLYRPWASFPLQMAHKEDNLYSIDSPFIMNLSFIDFISSLKQAQVPYFRLQYPANQ